VWKGGEQVMSQREGEVLRMKRLGEQLFRQRRVKKQLLVWSSEEHLFWWQRRVKKTSDSVELWGTAV
jgi:hypothetical protein